MPCFHPLTGYYSREVNDTGKRSLVFNVEKALCHVPVKVPCGRCIGCRLDRSLSWAVRCVHEASLHDENCFITLTFDGCHVGDGSLHVRDFQNFLKRLRQFVSPRKFRFFHCGEYGSKLGRPHHHACIFGYDFPDKKLWSRRSTGNVYTSEILAKLWPYGFSTVGAVTMESAAYVARYVLKKWSKDYDELMQNGLVDEAQKELYDSMCALSDEEARKKFYGGRKPEYVTMSRGGCKSRGAKGTGLAREWYEKYSSDIFPSGFVVLPNGKKCKIPKYYDLCFELDNVVDMAMMKGERCVRGQEDPDNTRSRLLVREEIQNLRSKKLVRGYEND